VSVKGEGAELARAPGVGALGVCGFVLGAIGFVLGTGGGLLAIGAGGGTAIGRAAGAFVTAALFASGGA